MVSFRPADVRPTQYAVPDSLSWFRPLQGPLSAVRTHSKNP